MNRIAFNVWAVFVGLFLIFLGQSVLPPHPEQNTQMLVPPKHLQFFTLGYNEILADSLWLRVVQDFDTCGRERSSSDKVSPVVEDVVDQASEARKGHCEDSWSFRLIDAITEIAPRFREPYSSGAVILSVAVDDISGASKIYAKAIERFPGDWQIEYRAAYHYLYEQHDRTLAAKMLDDAGRHGAPFWVRMLAARLYSNTGAAELGKMVMEEFLAENPGQADTPHVKKRIAEIEAALRAEKLKESSH